MGALNARRSFVAYMRHMAKMSNKADKDADWTKLKVIFDKWFSNCAFGQYIFSAFFHEQFFKSNIINGHSMVLFGILFMEIIMIDSPVPSYCSKQKARQCITRLLRANQFSSWRLLRMPLIYQIPCLTAFFVIFILKRLFFLFFQNFFRKFFLS